MTARRPVMAALVLVMALSVCSFAVAAKAPAAHPWTAKPVLEEADRFQFAVISDVTGGRRPDVLEAALRDLNLMQPAFVMCIGDLTEGYTEDAQEIRTQRDALVQEMHGLDMRLYFLPGNHDISNPTMAKEWEERFGRLYYSFVYHDALFLCLDTEDPPATHISAEQARYVCGQLRRHRHVRWTFVFMHKPMWLEADGMNDPGWQTITKALADRPHTVFAGHYHNYIQSKRNGRDYIVLSTTGGASEVRGPGLGEFDHITWVTMDGGGPAIVNLVLGGILPKDVTTEEMAKVNDAIFRATYLATSGVASAQQLFAEGTAELKLSNEQPYELSIKGAFAEHPQLRVEPGAFEAELAPGASETVTAKVMANRPTDLFDLRPLVLNLSATYAPPGGVPVTAAVQRNMDIHGTLEGPDLLRNGRFEGKGEGWFQWVHTPEAGSLNVGNGEARAVVTNPPGWWSIGVGQYLEGMRRGGRYRLRLEAADRGGAGVIYLQVAVDEQEMPIAVLIDGQPSQYHPIAVGEAMAAHTVEFVAPTDIDLTHAKIVLCLAGMKDATLTDVSLREVIGVPAGAEAAPASAQ